MSKVLSFILVIVLLSCQQNSSVEVPKDQWDLFDSAAAMALTVSVRNKLEGVYAIDQTDDFGPFAVLKWSFTKTNNDSTFHLSMFCEKEISYFILEGKEIGDSILLNGYWRKMDSDETGKARFKVNKNGEQIIIEGTYGNDDEEPSQKIQLKYLRSLYDKPFEIVAHRGGGRNTDFLPSSENSIELILRAASFGASGVEVDIQLTKDNIPILYHDDKINDRLTEKAGIRGPVEDYTYDELKDIKLKKGEHIPKLRDALDSIVHKTPLRFVWLDAKKKTTLPILRALQKEFTEVALTAGRKLEIAIGIPDEEVYEAFKALPDHRNITSLCELSPEETSAINSAIWAPMWVKGLQEEEVAAFHAMKKRAFVWTVDKPKKIPEFMNEGKFDGIVSNFPSIVAYYHFIRQ